jgi:elongator complex protein 2
MASGSTQGLPISEQPPAPPPPPHDLPPPSPFASCRLAFDAAAASNSSQAVVWIEQRDLSSSPPIHPRPGASRSPTNPPSPPLRPPPALIYSSHSVLHLATREAFALGRDRRKGGARARARAGGSSDNNDDDGAASREDSASGEASQAVDGDGDGKSTNAATKTLLWRRQTSLRSSRTNLSSSPAHPKGGNDEVITCLTDVKRRATSRSRCDESFATTSSTATPTAVVVGYSSGRVLVWVHQPAKGDQAATLEEDRGSTRLMDEPPWNEYSVVDPFSHDSDGGGGGGGGGVEPAPPVTVLDGAWLDGGGWDDREAATLSSTLVLLTGSCTGAAVYVCRFARHDAGSTLQLVRQLGLLESSPLASVRIVCHEGDVLFLLGTAAPRSNKIHVYQCQPSELVGDEAQSRTGTASPGVAAQVSSAARIRAAGALHGHQDWVTCLDWRNRMLATGSKDCRIRLWDFGVKRNVKPKDADRGASDEWTNGPRLDAPGDEEGDDDIEGEGHDADEDDEQGESRLDLVHRRGSIANPGPSQTSSVLLEALLVGHEAAVTSVQWHPNPSAVFGGRDLVLLSASMDRTILIWALQDDGDGPTSANGKGCGVWTPLPRLGVAGGILGGPLGSSLLGFCRAAWEPRCGRSIVGHAYGGALHVWTLDDDDDDTTEEEAIRTSSHPGPSVEALDPSIEASIPLLRWRATPGLTGHFNAVTDLCWEGSRGSYFLSVSKDQTCRLWAPLDAFQEGTRSPIWTEISRPQVHGYDLMSVSSLSTSTSPHRIVTAADEKELRVYDAPLLTLHALDGLCGADSTRDSQDAVDRALRAYIPSLGLTNKSSVADKAQEEEVEQDDDDDDADITTKHESSSITHVPLERDLGVTSVWPEHAKLYGHNSEMYRVTSTVDAGAFPRVSDDPVLIASSTKARDAEAASIRLWDANDGKSLQILSSHKSTVVTMSFSSNGRFLATSGKDRRICLWKQQKDGFSIAWLKDSAHKRIVWSIHFNPADPSLFASGSRDGCVKVWKIMEDSDSCSVSLLHAFAPTLSVPGKPIAVTAVSFAPAIRGRNGYVAVGMDSGRIEVWQIPIHKDETPLVALSIPISACHGSAVTKLAWRRLNDDRERLCLASSSFDHGCKLFDLLLKEQ